MGFMQSLKDMMGLKEAPAAPAPAAPAPAPLPKRSMLNNKTIDSWNNKAIILAKSGKYDDAVKEFDKVLATSPNDAEMWAGKAMALKKLGKTAEAENAAKKAAELR
jgi:Flp pilus assembly protein TadD